MEIDWREYIHSDPDILLGKPVIKGTRISVEFILEMLAGGWTEQMLLENYPGLKKTDLQAVFAFLTETMQDLKFFSSLKKSA